MPLRARLDPGDFRSSEIDAAHESALVEYIGVGAPVHAGGVHGGGLTLVHDDQVRAAAEVPTTGAVDVGESIVVHQEQRIAVILHAGLQANGKATGLVVVADAAIVADHRAVAAHAADDE